MGSKLCVTNDRENEVWWILEENHKGAMIGSAVSLGIVAGVATGGIVGKVIVGSLAVKAAAATTTATATATGIATEIVVGGVLGAAACGVVSAGVSMSTIKKKEQLFREQMMAEQREILEFQESYISGKRTLSLLRRITAKRFDVVTGKCYEISFNARTGATADSVKEYNLSDYFEREMNPKKMDLKQQEFLEEHTKSKVCVHCHDGYPEYVIVPCGHRCLCSKCQAHYQESDRECPLCRGSIQCVLKIIK